MNAHAHGVIHTTCPYCGVGCGLLATPDGRGGAAIAGDPQHPANYGKLCSKGSALGETLGLETRVLHPMLRQRDGSLAVSDWPFALDKVSDGLKRVIEHDGPDAVAFYLSGQLLTEDYYVANKLMKGFIGSANVDTNSRLCMASSVSGHRRAFGSDTVPGVYADLDEADLIVLVGSNAAWCHPVLYQRMLRNKQERRARFVVIDPRRTATAEEADLFLPIAPGMDSALFAGLLVHLADAGALNHSYISSHTTDFTAALAQSRKIAPTLAATAQAAGLAEQDVAAFFTLFATNERVVTCFSQGVNQSAQGTDKVNAIINCHLATGRIGRPGTGPFSLTGQPNAMGGREVGGLANQLAAHMGFTPEDIARVRRFWSAPRIAEREGRKAVDMFDGIARGDIKALWVMGTNPAVSLPVANAVRDALNKLELFIVSENVLSNDTVNAGAHIVLPAAAWGEKDGTVTNSERRISRQRRFLPMPGEAKPDWWAVSEVARRLGFGEAFAFRSAADIFREHAALSAFENSGTRDFNIGDLADIDDERYDALDPVQWPMRTPHDRGDTRFFAAGGFFTATGKAKFVAIASPTLKDAISAEFPFRLNTGRVRDQWHTMTRSGLSPRLGAHRPEPFVEIHPDDAAAASLCDGDLARVSSQYGECVLKTVVSTSQRCGSLFVPIHWSDETASSARVDALVAPHTDPFSGQPEAKATPVTIAPAQFSHRGFVIARRMPKLAPGTWWSRVTLAGGCGVLFASSESTKTWRSFVIHAAAGAEVVEYVDPQRDLYRAAVFADGRLELSLFVAPTDRAPQWDAIKTMLENHGIGEAQRRMLLSGQTSNGIAMPGPVVCACFGVGLTTLREAITSRTATSVEEIGRLLRAGTNCGSCVPELKRIIANERVP